MKRSLIIGMLLPLFYTQVGYYGQFIWLQWRIKESAREAWIAALPDAAFVRIDKAVVDANGNWEDRGLADILCERSGWPVPSFLLLFFTKTYRHV